MPKIKESQIVIHLHPQTSTYHSILVKNLGVAKAKQALLQSRISYAMDMDTYRKVMKYNPRH